MKNKHIIVLLVFLGISLSGSMAYAYDGNELLKCCDNYAVSKGSFAQGWCAGFINAIFLETDVRFCPPKGVKNIQKVLVVEKYMRDHPEKLHERAESLIRQSFVSAWPCSK